MDTNGDYQAEVARSLVDSCGVETAVSYCRNNHWEGVLQAVMVIEEKQARTGLGSLSGSGLES